MLRTSYGLPRPRATDVAGLVMSRRGKQFKVASRYDSRWGVTEGKTMACAFRGMTFIIGGAFYRKVVTDWRCLRDDFLDMVFGLKFDEQICLIYEMSFIFMEEKVGFGRRFGTFF